MEIYFRNKKKIRAERGRQRRQIAYIKLKKKVCQLISDRQMAAATFDYHLSLSFFHYCNKKLKVNKIRMKRGIGCL